MNNFTCPVCGQPAEIKKRVELERLTQIHFSCLHCGETGMDYEDIQPSRLRGTQTLRVVEYAQFDVKQSLQRYLTAAKAQHNDPLNPELKHMRELALTDFKQALRIARGKVPEIKIESLENEEVA